MLNVAVKKDGDETIIFYLDVKANPGNLWCSEVGMSGTECSLTYYNNIQPADESDVELAIDWLASRYGEEVKVYKRIPNKILKKIWED